MKRRGFAAGALFLAGCSAPPPQPDVAALRTSDTEASRIELEQVVSSALDGVDVTLADDVLMQASYLTLERRRQERLGSPPEPGRDYGRPQRFQLVLDGGRCFLVHDATGLRWMLRETTCDPE